MAKNSRTQLPWFASPWVITGAVVFACGLSMLVLIITWATRPGPAPLGAATAVLNVTYVPTTSVPLETPLPTIITPTVYPTPLSGVIAIGAYVQVSGTGGTGLRLRSQPGLDGEVLLLGVEAEVFLVDDGPQDVDGYTWWHLVGPYEEERQGWAVSNYLTVIQNPE